MRTESDPLVRGWGRRARSMLSGVPVHTSVRWGAGFIWAFQKTLRGVWEKGRGGGRGRGEGESTAVIDSQPSWQLGWDNGNPKQLLLACLPVNMAAVGTGLQGSLGHGNGGDGKELQGALHHSLPPYVTSALFFPPLFSSLSPLFLSLPATPPPSLPCLCHGWELRQECGSTVILVGAPQARGHKAQQNSRPGALYRCPISAKAHDCERVDIDGDVETDRESKDNQWLGVTVKSQGIGGKVVTCAHLYELRQRVHEPSETRDPIGRCYVLSDDLTERDDLDGGEWKFCEGRPQTHEQFGFCQQGLAASFTPDNNFILFGAPGTYNWKGELRVQLLNQSLLDLGFYDDGPYEVADEKQQNAQLIPVPYHSYLGMACPLPWCQPVPERARERAERGARAGSHRPKKTSPLPVCPS
ncbi:hypothetical protein JZ751_021162 [Albula glossodonta]|uniref:Integrin alpha-7 n=1 Tax=Albula glossodonta TaxID=121402 RepID=A0A8T2NW36_9TELE|nr:hypothetical protein JZ751_021162 [Albula glossodonta]